MGIILQESSSQQNNTIVEPCTHKPKATRTNRCIYISHGKQNDKREREKERERGGEGGGERERTRDDINLPDDKEEKSGLPHSISQ